ncbi:1-(5-phosphoribosyl)-5-[(5-phosphoribosylamino)methylideneamino]imidazole-4-carboxamide isomerase [Anaerosinus massiliensis]|uniref:1-(5-phosphoribosyl)-5-[(5- phosphoribosylamino)methylideneamino]imidazole-4- carboxamide isomerase n=1 Tax=Massilibacillus massiliensis TaxID=1806837 RepID=UPI000A460755|nr:1-(5-phosphoribosyl)-5-[(5-phosphoribosylamino)methylideneamino]imidazole-4-carboxamide isomerase [Massilibacillus massiliensis]
MIIFPAIDIRDGKCVRLTEGRFDQETIFADDPTVMAKKWAMLGAEFLHIVDLDGAVAKKSVNLPAIQAILENVQIPIQLGGGIRTMQDIENVLKLGVNRVILGSVAVQNPALVKEACEKFQDKVVVGIDARDGVVAVDGWAVSGGIEAEKLAKKMAAVGVTRIVYTDISRDGTLRGVNTEETANVAKISGVKVIASGGVRSIQDILDLKKVESDGVEGVIVGKAIYTNSLDLREALKVAKGNKDVYKKNYSMP